MNRSELDDSFNSLGGCCTRVHDGWRDVGGPGARSEGCRRGTTLIPRDGAARIGADAVMGGWQDGQSEKAAGLYGVKQRAQ